MAGTALSAFSADMLNMYLNTPCMTQDDGVRPTQEGTPVAKDIWMFGAGASMIIDSMLNTSARRRRAAKRRVSKIQDAKEERVEAINSARDEQHTAHMESSEDARAEHNYPC